MRGRLLACSAGTCAALASVTGKLATGHLSWLTSLVTGQYFWHLALLVRILLIGCTVALNGVMWTTFVEAMQFLNSSEASVLNVGTNILLSGALGWLLFGETVSAGWWCGASLIVSGVTLMHSVDGAGTETKKVSWSSDGGMLPWSNYSPILCMGMKTCGSDELSQNLHVWTWKSRPKFPSWPRFGSTKEHTQWSVQYVYNITFWHETEKRSKNIYKSIHYISIGC